MNMTPEHASWFAETFSKLVANVGQVVLGKPRPIGLAFTCLLSEGHLLLEDYPGTGKTSLARALAATVQGSNSRIQFTPDLLPSDVTGVTIYDQSSKHFEFHKGPIFASIVLADEINRASPKTQSALLEVMEESKVTVDGVSHSVGNPFMVIATQNPIEHAGTYRLPEAQLDRFLMKTSLGYPDHASTVEILERRAYPQPPDRDHPADHPDRGGGHGRIGRDRACRSIRAGIRFADRGGDPQLSAHQPGGLRPWLPRPDSGLEDLGGRAWPALRRSGRHQGTGGAGVGSSDLARCRGGVRRHHRFRRSRRNSRRYRAAGTTGLIPCPGLSSA